MRMNQAKERRRNADPPSPPSRGKVETRKPEAKMRPVRSASPLNAAPPSVAQSPEPPLADIHFGVLLRRARERRGLSMQDVARVTRISDKWLPALEEARLDHLPAPVFVSGYVRSYARVVGLDEGDLLDRYHALNQQLGNSCPPARLPVTESSEETSTTPPRPTQVRWLPVLLAVVMTLGVALWAVLRARGAV